MTITTKIRGLMISGVALATLALPAAADSWRGWGIHPEDYPNSIAMNQFAADVTKATEGRVEAQMFNNGILGDQPDAIEQTRAGALQFANFNMGPMGEIVPATNVMSLPFIFNNLDHMHHVMDGPVGQAFSDALAAQGLVALSWFDSGARSFYNTKHAIMTPEDMKGLKFRVMNNDLFVQMVDDLGGNATPMAYGEVYQSLKTGVIDGAENNYPSFESSNHYEVAKYYSITDHLIIPECVCVNTAAWEALSDADKAAVKKAAVDAATTQRSLWAEREKASRAKVESAGVTVNEVTDKTAFQEAMAPIYEAFLANNPDLAPMVKEIRETK
ncbi:TRAP transporter substrate-binding protein [Phaeovulum sp. W22_SRMD_FR3]|uniref:TRAP transporter substrate-binding protein n=1 Tax=Phaeovulum sp. W22_SRMD_FR3 TaxID=3240274 RepID=UPI003F990AD5